MGRQLSQGQQLKDIISLRSNQKWVRSVTITVKLKVIKTETDRETAYQADLAEKKKTKN